MDVATGPILNTLLVVVPVVTAFAVIATAIVMVAWLACWLGALAFAPVTRRRRERENLRRERSMAAIRAEREERKREWAREKASRT